MRAIVLLLCALGIIYGQNEVPKPLDSEHRDYQVQLSQKIGNFSLELLYKVAKSLHDTNFIISPITAWTVLAVISEAADGNTLKEVNYALRMSLQTRNATRLAFREMAKLLNTNTSTIELAKSNAIFVDQDTYPERDFQSNANQYYDTYMVPLNFSDTVRTANVINSGISKITHGRIPKLVDEGSLADAKLLLTSAIYFRGKWTAPFDISNTKKLPFYDQNNIKIGEVNMMYSRFTYPFANIRGLEARVIEIPYGVENRLSMLIMLPNPGVSLANMFKNFLEVPIQTVFEELRISQIEYGEDQVDCFIPRFKIESDFELTDILKNEFHIRDLFDPQYALLPGMARFPLYVSKVIHKAEIEVNEEGTTASGVSAAEFANRIGIVRFEANRPFAYVIIEKLTNSIVFGGLYRKPIIY